MEGNGMNLAKLTKLEEAIRPKETDATAGGMFVRRKGEGFRDRDGRAFPTLEALRDAHPEYFTVGNVWRPLVFEMPPFPDVIAYRASRIPKTGAISIGPLQTVPR